MALFGTPNIDRLREQRNVKGLAKAVGYRKDKEVQIAAVKALAGLGEVDALAKALDERPAGRVLEEPSLDAEVQVVVAQALADVGNDRAIPVLVKCALTHPRAAGEEIRPAAAAALSQIGAHAVAPLIEALDVGLDPSAARAVHAEAISLLSSRWHRDVHLLLVESAARALGEIEWQPAGERLARLEHQLAHLAEEAEDSQLEDLAKETLEDLVSGSLSSIERVGGLTDARQAVTSALEQIYGWNRPHGLPEGYRPRKSLASRQVPAPLSQELRSELLISDLEWLKGRLQSLPARYPPPMSLPTAPDSVGQQAGEQIPIVCRNLDEALTAIRTGRDRGGNPITLSEVGKGLEDLVNRTRRDGFSQMMLLALRPAGISVFERSMTELASIAAGLAREN